MSQFDNVSLLTTNAECEANFHLDI